MICNSILVACKSNGREKCSSKGVEHQSFTCALEFTIMTVSKKKSRQRNQSLSAFYYVIVECFTLIVLYRRNAGSALTRARGDI